MTAAGVETPRPGLLPPPPPAPRSRTLAAMLMSLVTHTAALIAVGSLWNPVRERGASTALDRSVGIALVQPLPDRRHVTAPQPAADPSEPSEAGDAASALAVPSDFSPPLDLAGALASIQAAANPATSPGLGDQVPRGRDAFVGSASPSPSTGNPETTTTVFGISGSGHRFVYVFDRSDSMNGFGGRPLRAAKAELIRSLQTLGERQYFQIIFYNNRPVPFRLGGTPLKMAPGEPGYLNAAEQYVRSISAYGGTSHRDALRMALRLAPDVIFFLTDARVPRLSDDELHEIQQRADEVGTVIHAIEFGDQAEPPASSFLRDLAEMNRGQYQYLNIHRLTD